ncbi:MAG: 1-acyl-sn-glycerol-3-phosphate acyltransferase [Desulfobacterota bacterium]|nr:1-acyl-sn-glycerol-3-phosphate acyltransferase [Thermodesulfobacteriota bacterium]
MKASLLKKLSIMATTVGSTLGISIYVLYMRLTNTYDRLYADSILRWWSSLLLRAVGATWEVKNPYGVGMVSGRPCIIMSNHRSHYDIPLIYVSLPGSIRMLTKKELFKIPVWGRGMKAAEFISIDRRNHEQALKDLAEARRMMEGGIVLWIAPEGTRTRTGRLGEFKKGGFVLALQIGAVIVPVGIRGSEKIHKPESSDLNCGQNVEVNIGETIDASHYGDEERDRLMGDVRAAITRLAGEGEGGL